jgi:hypothetical protein
MILRRISSAIKRQDWATVIIEFILVVAGVLVALQFDNWNQNRLDQEKERVYVKRLLTEAKQGIQVGFDYMELRRASMRSSLGLVQKLNDKSYCDTLTNTLKDELLVVTDFRPPEFAFVTANEMIQSGQMQLLGSDDVRAALSEVINSTGFITRQWERYVRSKKSVGDKLYPLVGFTFTGDISRPLAGEYDLANFNFTTIENLCGNPPIIGLISDMTLSELAFVGYLELHQERVENHLSLLESYAKRIGVQTP